MAVDEGVDKGFVYVYFKSLVDILVYTNSKIYSIYTLITE